MIEKISKVSFGKLKSSDEKKKNSRRKFGNIFNLKEASTICNKL
jgi:hypothetical protein